MSFVNTHPEMLIGAAGDLGSIGAAVASGNAVAAGPTAAVIPPAADPVSASMVAQFAAHAGMYQAMAAQAAAVHEMFVATLGASAGSYAATELANTAAL